MEFPRTCWAITVSAHFLFSKHSRGVDFRICPFPDHPFIVDTTPSFALTELRRLGHKEVDKRSLAALLDAESNVKRLMQAGILIAAGTDAPIRATSRVRAFTGNLSCSSS